MSKYGNRKTEVDGIIFDSKKEANYYLWLLGLVRKKEIRDLKMQVKMPFVYEGKTIFNYVADFTYYDRENKYHVIDVKSEATAKIQLFRLKKKLIEAQYKIEIEIV